MKSMWNNIKVHNTYQSKLSKKLVVSSHLSLTLTHFNLHLSLSISSSRKYLKRKKNKKQKTSCVGNLIKTVLLIKKNKSEKHSDCNTGRVLIYVMLKTKAYVFKGTRNRISIANAQNSCCFNKANALYKGATYAQKGPRQGTKMLKHSNLGKQGSVADVSCAQSQKSSHNFFFRMMC